jgi:hypothetical protein
MLTVISSYIMITPSFLLHTQYSPVIIQLYCERMLDPAPLSIFKTLQQAVVRELHRPRHPLFCLLPREMVSSLQLPIVLHKFFPSGGAHWCVIGCHAYLRANPGDLPQILPRVWEPYQVHSCRMTYLAAFLSYS